MIYDMMFMKTLKTYRILKSSDHCWSSTRHHITNTQKLYTMYRTGSAYTHDTHSTLLWINIVRSPNFYYVRQITGFELNCCYRRRRRRHAACHCQIRAYSFALCDVKWLMNRTYRPRHIITKRIIVNHLN